MKLTVDQALLTKTIKRAMLTSGNALNPAHALVKLEAKKGLPSKNEPDCLSLTSAGGIMNINLQIRATVTEAGVVAVNTRELSNAASNMPSGPVSITTTEKRYKISGGNRSLTGALADPTSIQPTPEPDKALWMRVPVDALEEALERVGFATSDWTDQAPKSCDGVRLIGEPDALTSVVLTGFLFVAHEQKVKLELKRESPHWEATLTTRALPHVAEIIAEAKSEKQNHIELFANDFFIYVIGPSTLFVVSVPGEAYPPWKAFLDSYPKTRLCVVQRLALIESIKAAKATSSGLAEKMGAGADFHIVGPDIVVSRDDPDNEFREQIPLAEIEPNVDAKFRVSLSYMHDILAHAPANPAITPHPNGTMLLVHEGSYRASVCLMTARETAPKAEPKADK